MTEDKKIKIGKLCNKIATVLFVLFFYRYLCYAYNEQKIFYNISCNYSNSICYLQYHKSYFIKRL